MDFELIKVVLQVGSRLPELQKIAVDIFQLCLIHDITIESQWIPRSVNHVADALSKIVDLDDWQLNPRIFQMLNKQWGPITIDQSLPAPIRNYLDLIHVSGELEEEAEAEAIDSFSQDWSEDNNWLCPPISLIIPTLRHMRAFRARGTLIVPSLPSAIFWPVITPESGRFASSITDFLILPKLLPLCIPGQGQLIVYQSKPSLFMGTPAFDMLALQVTFS